MINYLSNSKPKVEVYTENPLDNKGIFWVDLIQPTEEERKKVEDQFKVELFTKEESEEIESSSKYVETDDEIGINLNFMNRIGNEHQYEPVSFILKDKILFTERDSDFKSFQDSYRKIKVTRPEDGDDAFLVILDTRIDYLADIVEGINDKIAKITKELVKAEKFDSDLLLEITALQEQLLGLRENTVEIQRLLSTLIKSKKFPNEDYETVRVMLKDLSSILEFTSFCFDRVEFLQNTFQGLIDMEQNRVMKVFTVITVCFAPPTLIAGIFGMNFTNMAGLEHPYGFPITIFLMVVSMVGTLLYFKFKNWL
ncbi:magnesium/cobalt transporter CorA [Flavobacteriaceae bacterium Ap0902]|nr:magnesium/cobalt transporter CorA [Flavobacteriaceae bacterium Ap0902]